MSDSNPPVHSKTKEEKVDSSHQSEENNQGSNNQFENTSNEDDSNNQFVNNNQESSTKRKRTTKAKPKKRKPLPRNAKKKKEKCTEPRNIRMATKTKNKMTEEAALDILYGIDIAENEQNSEEEKVITNESKFQRCRRKKKKRDQKYLLQFQDSFFSMLQVLLPPVQNSDPRPVLACIETIYESSNFRVNLGSNNILLEKGRKKYHTTLNYTFAIPPGCCVLFHYSSTIHSGGEATTPCTRTFSIFAEENDPCFLENKNFSNVLQNCKEGCLTCHQIERFMIKNCSCKLVPDLKDEDLFSKFNLDDHGFCVLPLRKQNTIQSSIKNSVYLLETNFTCMQFQSIDQEEKSKYHDGKRNMMKLEVSKHRDVLSSETIIKNASTNDLLAFLEENEKKILNFLDNKYCCKYKRRGQTILTNTGILGNQRMHLDNLPKQPNDTNT